MTPNKACPVVLRGRDGADEILAFRHPLAGLQLVKGTIEPGETPHAAAVRELSEEAGIDSAQVIRDLGLWAAGYQAQIWSFHEVTVSDDLPEAWSHFTEDGGGHVFQFFWHPLNANPSSEWHSIFVNALGFIRARKSQAA